jgi:hypothetical protein
MMAAQPAGNRKGIDYVMTYDECAAELGVSRTMIYFIERRALVKAANVLRRHGYRVADFFPPNHRKEMP